MGKLPSRERGTKARHRRRGSRHNLTMRRETQSVEFIRPQNQVQADDGLLMTPCGLKADDNPRDENCGATADAKCSLSIKDSETSMELLSEY